jgi:hypothetical protein
MAGLPSGAALVRNGGYGPLKRPFRHKFRVSSRNQSLRFRARKPFRFFAGVDCETGPGYSRKHPETHQAAHL